ncbi:MAG: OmpA family protein, partial [Bacteroidota bacterium]
TAKIIYFDYNKSDIRKNAKAELFEIVNFLKDNPSANVELSTHTDARGSQEYNQKLSQRRADAAVRYIVRQGIEKNRIQARGYGESQPTNRCKDGVNCPESAHAENRRCELTITGIR